NPIYLFVSGAVLGSQCLVLGLLGLSALVPTSAKFLGNVSNRGVRHTGLDLSTLVVAKPEEGGQRTLGRVRVLGALLLAALLALGGGAVSGHLAVVALLVLFSHLVEALLLLVIHGLQGWTG